MSQENVDIVRCANDAFNRGDVEGVLTFCAEDIDVEDLMNAPDVPSMVHDIQGLRQLLTAWVEAFDEFRGEVAEYIDAGNHVVCVTDYYGKSREGLALHLRVANVFEVRDGKMVQVTLAYENRDQALEAVGLSEQDGHTHS